jgi:hypothetical protein
MFLHETTVFYHQEINLCLEDTGNALNFSKILAPRLTPYGHAAPDGVKWVVP